MVNEETLRGWIGNHLVCWECAPLVEMYGGRRVQVGFELRLFGRHSAREAPDRSGFLADRVLHEKLKEIALFALPKDVRPSRYEIDAYRAAVYFRPESGATPEVQLTVRVLHREEYFDPIDDCETRCAREIQERLRALGARPNTWIGSAPQYPAGKAS